MEELKQQKANLFTDTYALVLCGGQSSRMGNDKSMLQYHNKPQRYYLYDMLQPLCKSVFISCNEAQANNIKAGYTFIKDEKAFGNIGPMTALLTAFSQHPNKNILLIGCDYPFLKAGELQIFSNQCKKLPVAFYNKEENIYEPMLAWYPFTCFDKLKTMFDEKQFSLQQFLKQNEAIKHLPTNINSIKSIDTTEAFTQAIKILNAG